MKSESSPLQLSRQQQYEASLAKLKLAVNTANSFIWEYDVKRDRVTIDYDLLGYERSIPLRTSASQHNPTKEDHFHLTHPEDRERVLEKVNQLLSGEIPAFTETYRHFTNKKLCWYTTHFSTYLYDEENKPEIIICLTQDVTQQRKRELEAIKEREANRIKTEFIANISHELRTPLNAVLGFSSLIANNNDTEGNRLFIEILQRNNETLLNLIDSILHFANQESGSMLYKIEEVDLREICQVAMGFESFNVNPDVKFIFDENLPSVLLKTDKERIIQVLFHLLDNAKKYTTEGHITLSYHLLGDQEVKVEIADTGIGLDNREIQKIFSHFYKADSFKQGLGLGLSIAKKTIMDLGGHLGVDSTPGKGSRFWFTLPLAE
ncbi:sensor histidine kinase [Parabacteroides sp. PF5-6]|uniref:sensor histidine kinase n=1 Tax=Parabacteroides sp. PF5-6 TaxID=1742403 RepID=UPI002405CF9A|nr:sensor histidine kinase [Parabacteroides sp. PF5-6]MDF9831503.1 signal transduction histidine kinase [Parabacteroides sp. PF5-6]